MTKLKSQSQDFYPIQKENIMLFPSFSSNKTFIIVLEVWKNYF